MSKQASSISHAPLTIRLFGPFAAQVGGQPLPRLRTRSIEWLLALLVLRHGRPVERDWLAGTLWPESRESGALKNLRNDLSSLRAALGPEQGRIQSPSRDVLVLDLSRADVDVLRFDAALRDGGEERLREAAALYAGPLLEGCAEEWVLPERETRAAALLRALETLAEGAAGRGDHAEALSYLSRAEAIDPLRDSIQRRRLQALDANGDAPAAVLAYREYRLRLHRELNAEPDPETARLFEQIRARARTEAAQGSPISRASSSGTLVAAGSGGSGLHPSALIPRPAPAPLPHSLTPLIGREEEVAVLRDLLRSHRLVTLVGTGGVGKTRLAMEVAGAAGSGEADRPVFVTLAGLAEPGHLESFTAATLGLRDEAAQTRRAPLEEMTDWLSTHRVLLVLDNCEHLIEASAAMVQSLLERCPHLRVLATSRQRLGLMGENVWRVQSLAGPDPERLPTDSEHWPEYVGEFAAVRLFVERAALVRQGFQLSTPEEARLAARICRRLDGVPLAIELAASRTGMLTLAQIDARLADRFRLLTGGSRAALPRQQTLRALIDWSYDLLSEEERALLRRLSVFAGGWTLEVVEDSLDPLGSLVERSLVFADPGAGQDEEPRYRMLETIREYALEKLREAGEETEAREWHHDVCLRLVEAASERLYGPDERDTLARLDAEMDNFRAALAWAHQSAAAGAALPLTAALAPFWEVHGYLVEGGEYLDAALAGAGEPEPRLRARALVGAAALAAGRSDRDAARPYALEGLEIFRRLGDARGIADGLYYLGAALDLENEAELSRVRWHEALEWYARCGWKAGRAYTLIGIARATIAVGRDLDEARAALREAMAVGRSIGSERIYAAALHRLGRLERDDAAVARPLLEQSLDLSLRLDQKRTAAECLNTLGNLERGQGNHARAAACFEQAAALWRDLGNRYSHAWEVLEIGNTYYQNGDYAGAAPHYVRARALFQEVDTNPDRGWGLDTACNTLGSTLFQLGEYAAARDLHLEALALYVRRKSPGGIVWTLERLGVVEAVGGGPELGARLLGAAAAGRERTGLVSYRWDAADRARAEAAARAALGDARFESLFHDGRQVPIECAMDLVLWTGTLRSSAEPQRGESYA